MEQKTRSAAGATARKIVVQLIAFGARLRIVPRVHCGRGMPDGWSPVPRTVVGGVP